jgi:hypothetical protein
MGQFLSPPFSSPPRAVCRQPTKKFIRNDDGSSDKTYLQFVIYSSGSRCPGGEFAVSFFEVFLNVNLSFLGPEVLSACC